MSGKTDRRSEVPFNFFPDASAETKSILAARASPRSAQKGEILFHQDDPAQYVFSIKKGRIRLYQESPEGQNVGMRILGRGTFFAGISVVPGASYPATAEAMEETELFVWSRVDMLRLMRKDAGLCFAFLEVVFARLRDVQARLTESTAARVERRIALTVLRLAGQLGTRTEEGIRVEGLVTNEVIAEMSGTTLYTVSRTLTDWKRRGWLAPKRGRLIIKEPHELTVFANS